MKTFEYIVKQYIPDEDREFLRKTGIDNIEEAISWADFYGTGTSVYKRSCDYKEEQVYYSGLNLEQLEGKNEND